MFFFDLHQFMVAFGEIGKTTALVSKVLTAGLGKWQPAPPTETENKHIFYDNFFKKKQCCGRREDESRTRFPLCCTTYSK